MNLSVGHWLSWYAVVQLALPGTLAIVYGVGFRSRLERIAALAVLGWADAAAVIFEFAASVAFELRPALLGSCPGCLEEIDGDVGFTDQLAVLANLGPCA